MSEDPGLAAERTTLAWRRTGLSLVVTGVLIARGLDVAVDSAPPGQPVVGAVVLALGVVAWLPAAAMARRRAASPGLARPTARVTDLVPVAVTSTLVGAASFVVSLLV